MPSKSIWFEFLIGWEVYFVMRIQLERTFRNTGSMAVNRPLLWKAEGPLGLRQVSFCPSLLSSILLRIQTADSISLFLNPLIWWIHWTSFPRVTMALLRVYKGLSISYIEKQWCWSTLISVAPDHNSSNLEWVLGGSIFESGELYSTCSSLCSRKTTATRKSLARSHVLSEYKNGCQSENSSFLRIQNQKCHVLKKAPPEIPCRCRWPGIVIQARSNSLLPFSWDKIKNNKILRSTARYTAR